MFPAECDAHWSISRTAQIAKPFQTTIDAILADDPNAALGFVNPWLLVVLRERDSGGVQRALSNMGDGGCFDENIPFPNGWCEGLAAWVRGDESTARAAFESARKELTEKVHNQPDYAAALCALGVVDAVLGNKEDAIREGERAVELTPVSKNAIEGATLVRYLAVIYAWAGEKDRAIQRLAETTTCRAATSATVICVCIHCGIRYEVIRGLKRLSLH